MGDSIPPDGPGVLSDYERTYRYFNWASLADDFDWSRGGTYNVASEAIDRHARNWRKNKIALFSVQASGDVKKFTFGEMADLTSRFASGLEKLGAVKGARIGDGSIIASRSFVRGEIPPGCIAAGSPAVPRRHGIRWTRERY